MPTARNERHPALIAEFGSPADARAAIEALENHGIDGLEVAVLDGSTPPSGREPADERAVTHVGGRVAQGVGLGALIGATLLGVVALVFMVAAGLAAIAILPAMAVGAGFGAAVGAFWSVERGTGLSEDWEKTFEQPDDADAPMRIAVYTTAPTATERARQVLEDHRPTKMQAPRKAEATA